MPRQLLKEKKESEFAKILEEEEEERSKLSVSCRCRDVALCFESFVEPISNFIVKIEQTMATLTFSVLVQKP